MANQIYFEGDFYQCADPTVAGESPRTAPDKWRKITLLTKWRYALAQLTYANLLTLDGQSDKAQLARNEASGREKEGLDDLTRAEANDEEARDRAYDRGHRPTATGAGRSGALKASVVLDDAYRLIGWDAEQIDTRDFGDVRMCFSQALQKVWEAWWWWQTMQCARLQFATTLKPDANYTPGQTAYDPRADVYMVALRDCTGADISSFEQYVSEKPELELWDEAVEYEAGDQFHSAGIDYQCWTDAPAGTLPTDTNYFAPMQNWTPRLPWQSYGGVIQEPFGPVRSVSHFDPRHTSNPEFFELEVRPDATFVRGMEQTHPWVWARRVTPIITADEYDPAATYEAAPGSELVYGTPDTSFLLIEGGYILITV